MPNPTGKNGHKSSPPDDELRPFIERLVARGFTNPEIVKKLRERFDPDIFSTSESLVKKKRAQWGILSARGQAHTIDTVGPAIERVHTQFPSIGCRIMKATLLRDERIAVSKKLILQYMNLHYHSEVLARKAHRLARKQYWTVGVNDTWTMDQHDKWRQFQLFLHIGLEPHSGLILWLKIWWTNRNPRLVCGWYCDTIEKLGYIMPLLTQSDPGTENNGIANAQTVLRHRHDPSLADSLQHKFKGNKGNVKPEIAWRRLRYCWTDGYEQLIQHGISQGLYDPDNALERLVFHYTFIPWLQKELDNYVELANDTRPRFNRHKVLPHGRPIEIFQHPEKYDTKDFSVNVDKAHLEAAREKYAPPDHPVFHLVPPAFAARAAQFYRNDTPEVNRNNVWDVYRALLHHFLSIRDETDIHTEISRVAALPAVGDDPAGEEQMDILPLKRYRPPNHLIGDLGVQDEYSSSEEEDQGYNVWTSDEDSSSGSSVDNCEL